MKKKEEPAWESLIGAKIEAHRGTYKPQRIEDSRKRNAARATKRWRKKNWEHYQTKQKEWLAKNPDKVKTYQQRNKKNVKRWAEEHPERVRELGRINDRKRAKTEKRKAWTKEYMKREDVIERRRERDRKRAQSPERMAQGLRREAQERPRPDCVQAGIQQTVQRTQAKGAPRK